MILLFIVLVLVLVELLCELTIFRKRLNNYFFIVNKGIFFKNTIFMSVNKQGRKVIGGKNGFAKVRFFYNQITNLITMLPKEKKIKTKTHKSIVSLIKTAEKNKLIKDLKINKCGEKFLFTEKISIKNYKNLFEKKTFYKVSFVVI